MKNVLKWTGITLAFILLSVLIVPMGILLLWYAVGLMAILLVALGDGGAQSEAATAALEAARLPAYVEYAPYHSMTVDDCLTFFELAQYDNHTDNNDLRAGLIVHAAATVGWHVEVVTPGAYAARIPAEAAFLLPDTTFDAWFESSEGTAFFDQESGLFVHLRKGETPKSGTVRADKLTVPHNGFVYEMETHGGFHGDGSTFYALIVPKENRTAFESTLAAHADWHEGVITNEEYRQLHDRRFFQALPLYPAADISFEWCSFVDTYARMYPDEPTRADRDVYFPAVMQELGAHFSANWLVALYDADTGLFIYYEYDS